MLADEKLARNDVLFAVGCALAYVIVTLLMPRVTPLIASDSLTYLGFSAFRTALYPAFLYLCRSAGLSLSQVTGVQLALFATALSYLLVVLMRNGFPKALLAIMVALMAGNVLFSSFHRAILSESLFLSLTLLAIAWWIEYLRSMRIGWLMAAALALGLMIGLRPAGLGLLPLHLAAVWIRRPKVSDRWLALLFAALPLAVGAGGERLIYYSVQGATTASIAPNLLFGKAAMLIRPDMRFSGRHAATFEALARELDALYAPVQRYVAEAPTFAVRVQLSAIYEGQAQFSVMTEQLAAAAQRARIGEAQLRDMFSRQVIGQNLLGYLKLTLVNEIGQWSVMGRRFPPTARALSAYADAHPGMTLGGAIPAAALHPPPQAAAWVVYPGFLIAGLVSLILAVALIAFIARPALAASFPVFCLLIACFLSAMCQSYTLFVSLVNVWTPRFLMGVFPQIAVIALCLVTALLLRFLVSARRHAGEF